MAAKHEVLKIYAQISAVDANGLLFHKNRFQALLGRVKSIVDLVDKGIEDNTHDTSLTQSLTLLSITFEEILEYLVLFSTKDRRLAAHIIKYGSDEEQFIKWTERLQHCMVELKLGVKVFDVFDEVSDLKDFHRDIVFLQNGILDMVVLLHGSDNVVLIKSLESLLGHQSSVRATYQTKTAPGADLEINPKKIKYDKVIGHGGITVFNV
jgi:hypothetical protein